MSRVRLRFAYLVTEKWFWLAVSPLFFILPSRVLTAPIAFMSSYALYLTADGRLEAARAHAEVAHQTPPAEMGEDDAGRGN